MRQLPRQGKRGADSGCVDGQGTAEGNWVSVPLGTSRSEEAGVLPVTGRDWMGGCDVPAFLPTPMSRLSPLLQPEPDLSQRITGANRAMMSMGMINAKVIEAGAHRVCHTESIQNGSLLSSGNRLPRCHPQVTKMNP